MPTVVPSPRELSEARAVEYMLRIALRCVVSVCLLGLAFLSFMLDFMPKMVPAVILLFWVLHLAYTMESVWAHWSMQRRKLRKIERSYKRAMRSHPDRRG